MTAKPTQSEFTTWFQDQFGPPVFKTKVALDRARMEEAVLEARLGDIQRKIRLHNEYALHERAALYAWQAARSPRPGKPHGIAKARPRARST